MNMLEIRHLSKRFGDKVVLDDLNLVVEEENIFGFIGRNGAGKTTTMKIILGLLEADSGEVYVCGEKVQYGSAKTNRLIGYLPDVPEFYGYMNAREYLRLCGELSGMDKEEIKSRSKELLEMVGLLKEKGKIKGYSRGMKQRLGIAQALMKHPKLLICDEPTSALDPLGRKDILSILSKVQDETSVIFSTHILSDVEKICRNVAILEKGNIVMQGNVNDIRLRHTSGDICIVPERLSDLDAIANLTGGAVVDDKVIVPPANSGSSAMSAVLSKLADSGIDLLKIEQMEPDLDQLFMEVIGK
ncbi:ABC transporter ATP-binding protein [Agathobacter ruminis]|uniref:ABC transporter ATP-binding protein n=1 Tax=Agathobacter ruminis TaxID=1712665 RepID=A0A2G3E370_9FIRM|nr:ABC transporter ATP-binding protein [Agathobacter ruminis]MDC7300327.1 ABC transporter ATP-binding protein [Agathobacter ruminis]PHU37689.1 ABC transporter ATP-binding protein [Agathobacter ruminis]